MLDVLAPTPAFRAAFGGVAFVALGALVPVSAKAAAVTFIGDAVISGTGTDLSGLPPTILEDGVSPQNGLNGFGSAIAYAGNGQYDLLADRGPNKIAYAGGAAVDNTTSYDNRYQVFNIQVSANGASNTGYSVVAVNTGTTLLQNAQGVQYQGISTAFSTNPAVENHRLDTEGIRVAPDGTSYVSDEYGPYILHFDRQGHEIGQLTIPAGFSIAHPGPNAAFEAANNTTGRVTNRGLEGLAISPDGKTLVAALQSPLIQDGGNAGINDRILVYDLTHPSAPPKEYLYKLDNTSQAISEILAVNDHQFLVDERDGNGGPTGIKLLYEIDLDQATAPTDLDSTVFSGNSTSSTGLPLSSTPAGVTPLTKSLFANIGQILNADAADAFVNSAGLPDKIEGYAWGPDLANGDHLLLATNDNDFTLPGMSGYRPDYVFAFAVDPTAVPDFVAEEFSLPEPASAALLATGLIGLGRLRHRRKS